MSADALIVGGGPGGSALAMMLRRAGLSVTLVERATFPRFHIGESLTGEAGNVLRRLGLEAQLTAERFPVKHGVAVYGPDGGEAWFVPVMRRDERGELVSGTTWQVRRERFDEFMLDEARARGTEVLRGEALRLRVDGDGAACGASVLSPDGAARDLDARVVIDCSGQRTWLASTGVTGAKYLGSYGKQVAVFSQLRGPRRRGGGVGADAADNTRIFYRAKYHWAWFIPLDDETVSVGVVIPSAYLVATGEDPRTFLARELRELNPALAAQAEGMTLVEGPARVAPNYSYQVARFTGRGWACVGDAHRFVDPIFSFGLSVALHEAELLAQEIPEYLAGRRPGDRPFAAHERSVEAGADVLEDVVDLFWEQPFAFAFFVHARYRTEMIDMFAGRIYQGQPSTGLAACRALLRRQRSYDDDSLWSLPIGSRYQPERAPLWSPHGPVPGTEEYFSAER